MRHHLFLLAKNLAQRFDFRVHAVEQLLHRIDAQLALFIAVQREADGHVLGEFEQHRLVRLGIRCLRCEAGQCLLQRVLRAHRHGAEPRLKRRHVHAPFRIFSRLAELREQSQHGADVFFGHRVAAPAAFSRAACSWNNASGHRAESACHGLAQHGRRGFPSPRWGHLTACTTPSANSGTTPGTYPAAGARSPSATYAAATCPASTTSAATAGTATTRATTSNDAATTGAYATANSSPARPASTT